ARDHRGRHDPALRFVEVHQLARRRRLVSASGRIPSIDPSYGNGSPILDVATVTRSSAATWANGCTIVRSNKWRRRKTEPHEVVRPDKVVARATELAEHFGPSRLGASSSPPPCSCACSPGRTVP